MNDQAKRVDVERYGPLGCYVRHTDYAALLQQLAELQTEVSTLDAHLVDAMNAVAEGDKKLEAAERAKEAACGLLRKIDGLIPGEILGVQLCEELDAFLDANGVKP